MSNKIEVDGEMIEIGNPPYAVLLCGFKSADDVRRVAARYSAGTPVMNIDEDVVEWFKRHA